MTADDDLREAEQRARAHSRTEERMLAALEKRKNDSLNSVIQRKTLAKQQRQGLDDLPIRSYPRSLYRLPASVRRILDAEAARELEGLLAIVKDANDDMVGVPLA